VVRLCQKVQLLGGPLSFLENLYWFRHRFVERLEDLVRREDLLRGCKTRWIITELVGFVRQVYLSSLFAHVQLIDISRSMVDFIVSFLGLLKSHRFPRMLVGSWHSQKRPMLSRYLPRNCSRRRYKAVASQAYPNGLMSLPTSDINSFRGFSCLYDL
jgi:hypothetical protein